MKTISEIIGALERPQAQNDNGVVLSFQEVAEIVEALRPLGVSTEYTQTRHGDLQIATSDGVVVTVGAENIDLEQNDNSRSVKIEHEGDYYVSVELGLRGHYHEGLLIDFGHDDDETSGIRIWVKFVRGKLTMTMSDQEGSHGKELPPLTLDDFLALYRFRSTFRNLKKMILEL